MEKIITVITAFVEKVLYVSMTITAIAAIVNLITNAL